MAQVGFSLAATGDQAAGLVALAAQAGVEEGTAGDGKIQHVGKGMEALRGAGLRENAMSR